MKTTLKTIFATIFLFSAIAFISGVTVRESLSTDTFHPASDAFDSSFNTGWKLSSGETSGWMEVSLPTAKRFAGAMINLKLSENTTLQVSYLADNRWVALSSARIHGPIDQNLWVGFGFDVPQTTRFLFQLQGSDASSSTISNIDLSERPAPSSWGKILPASYSINLPETINLKASRLWDGMTSGVWYEPIWSIPSEIMNSSNPPVGVFGPLGNPQTPAQIIWELPGNEEVQTLKAYFLQDYRSLQFEFWNGATWANAVSFDSVGGTGWKRIDLANPVTTNRIRISFPGGWERARFISELEVWGNNGEKTAPRSLLLPVPASDGNIHVVDENDSDSLYEIQVQGNVGTLNVTYNGLAQSVPVFSYSALSNVTTFRFHPNTVQVRKAGAQFLKLPATVLSVVVKAFAQDGRISISTLLNDDDVETPAFTNVDQMTWSLGAPYSLEKLRVFAPGADAINFFTKLSNMVTPIVWTQVGTGWFEASLNGRLSDGLSFTADRGVSISEIQLFGSKTKDTDVPIERWWPQDGADVTASDNDSVSFLGWMGDSSVSPTIGTYHPRQADKIFWMPLNQMGLSSGTSSNLLWVGTLQGNSHSETYRLNWKKQNENFTLDQTTAFLATDAANLTLSGTTADSSSRVFVGGEEVPVTAKKWSVSVALALGYQNLQVDVYNPNLNRLRAHFEKGVYRTASALTLDFDLPKSDFVTTESSLLITGRANGDVGLTLKINGQDASLNHGTFAVTQPLTEGTNTFVFELKDILARTFSKTLTVIRDTTPPTISILTPASGSLIASHTVLISADSFAASGLWWSLNSGPWEAGVHSWTLIQTDGTYTATVQAKDRSGNLSAVKTVAYTLDTSAPLNFTIDSDVTGWTNNNKPTLYFQTIDVTSGIDHYEYAVDQGTFYPASSPLTLPTLADGEHTAFVKAVDRAGNSTISSIVLQIDTVPPAKVMGLQTISGGSSVSLTWNAVTESPISYRVQRVPPFENGAIVTTQAQLLDSGLHAGDVFTYTVQAIDRAGNIGMLSDAVQAQVGITDLPVDPQTETKVEYLGAQIVIPQNTLSNDVVRVLFNDLSQSAWFESPENPFVGKLYQARVVRMVDGIEQPAEHADFQQDVTFTIDYDQNSIPSQYSIANIRPFYYDSLWGKWMPIADYAIDPVESKIQFKTNHFSDFSIQATATTELTPQQLREVQFNPFGTTINHGPLDVSDQEGSVSTEFTEVVLPGKNHFDLVLKRIYDTQQAYSDAPPQGSDEKNPPKADYKTNGEAPWRIANGWRLNFPWIKWGESGVWMKGLDGQILSFGQASLTQEWSDSGKQYLVLETHEGSDMRATLKFQKDTTPTYFLFFWQNGSYNTYHFESATILMKDGREIRFDSLGRVAAILDSTGLNNISFFYSGNAPDKIVDSMGRSVEFTTTNGLISRVTIKAGNSTQNGINYEVNTKSELTKSTDLQGRIWNYQYNQIVLWNSPEMIDSKKADNYHEGEYHENEKLYGRI